MKKSILFALLVLLVGPRFGFSADRSVTIYPKSYSSLAFEPTKNTERKVQIEPALGFWSLEQTQLNQRNGKLNYNNSSMPYFQGSVAVELVSQWSGLFSFGALKREAVGTLSYSGISQTTTETAWFFPVMIGVRRPLARPTFLQLTPIASIEAGPTFLVLPQSVLQTGDGSTGGVARLSLGVNRTLARWLIQTQLFATAGKVNDASLAGVGGIIGAGIQL